MDIMQSLEKVRTHDFNALPPIAQFHGAVMTNPSTKNAAALTYNCCTDQMSSEP